MCGSHFVLFGRSNLWGATLVILITLGMPKIAVNCDEVCWLLCGKCIIDHGRVFGVGLFLSFFKHRKNRLMSVHPHFKEIGCRLTSFFFFIGTMDCRNIYAKSYLPFKCCVESLFNVFALEVILRPAHNLYTLQRCHCLLNVLPVLVFWPKSPPIRPPFFHMFSNLRKV